MWYWRFCTYRKFKWSGWIAVFFIRYLIGSTGKILYVVYINEKWIYASKTLSCTISECAIVRSILHETSVFLFIFWCSGAAKAKWTPRVWHLSLNSVEVNCVPASSEIIFRPHQPNFFYFPSLDWNISNFSITSSVVVLTIS